MNFTCPGCQILLPLPDGSEGRRIRCERCQCKFTVENPPVILEPAQVLPPKPAPAASANPAPAARPAAAPKKSSALPLLLGLGLIGLGGAGAWLFLKNPAVKAGAANGTGTSREPVATLFKAKIKAEDNFKVLGEVNDLPVYGWIETPELKSDAWTEKVAGGDLGKALDELRAELDKRLSGADARTVLKQAANDSTTCFLMMRHELIRLVGTGCLEEIRTRPEGPAFLRQVFSSPEWLEDFLVTGTFGSQADNANDLHLWLSLFRYDKRCTLPLYRKLAVAYARNQPGDWNDAAIQFSLIDAYQANLKNHQEGRMHASFDKLESWEMMHVTSCDDFAGRSGDSRHQRYLAYDRACPQPNYDGACWEIPWVNDNQFGDSCQADPYYSMWKNHYVRGAPSIKKVWGVCGTLSTFGAYNARAHGIPSFPVGQPGHCAYMLRYDDENWTTPYSVTWPTGAGSFFGGGDESIVHLMQAAYSNKQRPALLREEQHRWQREFFLSGQAFRLDSGSLKLYKGDTNTSCAVFLERKPFKELRSADSNLLAALKNQRGWRGATLDSGFTLDQPEILKFSLTSDDGSRLYIDGRIAIDNDGSHGAVLKESSLNLEAGKHTLRLEYFDGGGGATFDFKIGREKSASPDSRADIALDLALEQGPLNLNNWRLKAAEMKAAKLAPEAWAAFARSFTSAMRDYHHPAWSFLEQEVYPQLKNLTAQQKYDLVAALHHSVNISARDAAGNWLPQHLDKQAEFLADPASSVSLFSSLLAVYGSSKNDVSPVLSWGNKSLMGKPATSKAYLAALTQFLGSSRGASAADPINTFGELLANAETAGDISSFKAINQLAPSILKDGDPYRARHFDKGTANRFPKVKTFPGKVLSADGVLMPSSLLDNPTNLTHASVLSGSGYGGLIHTKREEKAFIDLKLPGKAKFSGIVIVNRYENSGERNVPLKVSVSSDGKTWTEIYTSKENLPAWEIDLSKQKVEAQFVRVERAEARNEFLNLRAFRVYGTPLY